MCQRTRQCHKGTINTCRRIVQSSLQMCTCQNKMSCEKCAKKRCQVMNTIKWLFMCHVTFAKFREQRQLSTCFNILNNKIQYNMSKDTNVKMRCQVNHLPQWLIKCHWSRYVNVSKKECRNDFSSVICQYIHCPHFKRQNQNMSSDTYVKISYRVKCHLSRCVNVLKNQCQNDLSSVICQHVSTF